MQTRLAFPVQQTDPSLRLRLVITVILMPMLACGTGCGGTSQSDVRRHAIRRTVEDEDTDTEPKTSVQHNKSSAVDGRGGSGDAPAGPQQPPTDSAPKPDSKSHNNSQGARMSSHPEEQHAAAEKPLSSAIVVSQPAGSENVSEKEQPSSDTSVATHEPLPLNERIRYSAANLERIGQAFQAYYKEHGAFPAGAIHIGGRPLLSWRVALLPYLGEEELFRQFKLDEPWNSRNNRRLLKSIPKVYKMPGMDEERTSYLALVGNSFALRQLHGRTEDEFTDGLENTILVVEVDKSLAVPWTEPRDFRPPVPLDSVRQINPDGLLALWATGDVGWLPLDTKPHLLMAMFTLDGGEPYFAFDIQREVNSVVESLEKSTLPTNLPAKQ